MDPFEEELDVRPQDTNDKDFPLISTTETYNGWSAFRDNLDSIMFDEWNANRSRM